MKLLLATLALIVSVSTAASLVDSSLNNLWTAFKQKYNKQYSIVEEASRRQIWENNLAKINRHNQEQSFGQHTYTLKMNKYGDLTHKEFVKTMNTVRINAKANMNSINDFVQPVKNLPKSVDWRTKGYVTPIKDQGQCGSCWAFSTVAALEGQHFNKTGKLVSLSEQNLVDCSTQQGNMGCDGGWPYWAYNYIISNNGIDTEDSYPYATENEDCRFNAQTVGATMTSYMNISYTSEPALTNSIATVGPISVCIDASQTSFQFYSTGVYVEPECSSTQLDHCVTAVGYDSLNGQDFYIVKNSWGTSWGRNGYIWMARNRNNMCGIATAATYPIV